MTILAMKILYGITKSNFGGAQRYVFDLAIETKKVGHDVAVMCGEGGTLVERLGEEGIRTIEIKGMNRDISPLDDLRSLFNLIRTLKHEKPDVFHTNSSKVGGLGNLAARLVGIKKIIFTSHGFEFDAPRPMWQKPIIKFFSWLTIVLSHTTICVSNKTRDKIAHWPFIKTKLMVIHNGIEEFSILPRPTITE